MNELLQTFGSGVRKALFALLVVCISATAAPVPQRTAPPKPSPVPQRTAPPKPSPVPQRTAPPKTVPAQPTIQKPAPKKKVVIRVKNYKNIPMLNMADVADFYGMKYLVNGEGITFLSKYSTITFTVNSRVMVLNNVQMYLSRPITVMDNVNYIGKSDFQLLLEPILRPKTVIPKTSLTTIVVDPGHGGKDVGAINGKDYEKNINLQVALRLASKLREKGFKVFMTRSTDKDVTLEQRTDFATAMKADLFVSIHCNSAAASVTGLETYIATPTGDPPVGDTKPMKSKCPANAYDLQNAYIAYYTQRTILRNTKCEDRGLRRKRFYVIRNTTCPSMLIEIGFISNDTELKSLKQSVRQEQIADAIVESLLRFRNLKLDAKK